ncbi:MULTISPECIES: transcriptional regulator [Cryobacterium]|uniref:Transcriptional regulator n=1 Tax=Cryobacterium breve TaxID=1259258 RepID=A0ABY2JAH1_9MICO|nr:MULTISPECIES: transcriptional regulator [Cryobacterium]TFC94475.1 transcriptional regulator [Cryobacterium sp. TmT3-12]TFD01951.1 transcriptional regulator [Cryobacterium breve]
MSADGIFNEIIHAPLRLRICGLLRSVDELDFAVLRDTLGVSDATLSKQSKALIDAGFVSVTKKASASRDDSRRITWLRLTATGRNAFDDHVRALRKISVGFEHLDNANS